MQLPVSNVPAVINPVLQPVLRDLHTQKEQLADKYLKIVNLISVISFPIGFFFYGIADDMLFVFYGEQWAPAAEALEILSLSLPVQMIQSTSGALFLICSETKRQFYVGVRNTITTVVSFILAAYFYNTIEAIAWAWTISLMINFFFTYFAIYKHILQVSIMPLLKTLIKPLIIGLVVGACLEAISNIITVDNKYVTFVIKCAFSAIIVLILLDVFKLITIKNLFKKGLFKNLL